MKHLNLLIAVISYATACVLFLFIQYYTLYNQTEYKWMYYIVILLIILGIFFFLRWLYSIFKKEKVNT